MINSVHTLVLVCLASDKALDRLSTFRSICMPSVEKESVT
jgi:hypothetical protein